MLKQKYSKETSGGHSLTTWGRMKIEEIFRRPFGPKSKNAIAAALLDEKGQPIYKVETVEGHLRTLRKGGSLIKTPELKLSGWTFSLFATFCATFNFTPIFTARPTISRPPCVKDREPCRLVQVQQWQEGASPFSNAQSRWNQRERSVAPGYGDLCLV